MGMHSFLKNVLKFTNAVLLLLGLFMSLFSLYLLLRFKKEVKEKEATSPVYPPPPPLAPETIAPPPPDIPHVIASEPWFLYAFGGAGVYIVLTAATGLFGAEHANRCCLHLYTYQLGLMLLGQGALAVAVFVKSDFIKMPEDITGNEAKAWNLVHKKLPVVQYFSVAVLAVQLLSVLLAMALSRAKRVALYDSDDEDDYYERHYGGGGGGGGRGGGGGQRRPLLNRSDEEGGVGGGWGSGDGGGLGESAGGASGGGGGGAGEGASASPGPSGRQDSWSRRMREKYGLDTSSFTYNPERPPPSRGGGPRRGEEEGEGGGKCVVM